MKLKFSFILVLFILIFTISSCHMCTKQDAYNYTIERIKAGRLQPEKIVFMPIDCVDILQENSDFYIKSSYVCNSKWSFDSTVFYYKLRCRGKDDWLILEQETTSRFYKHREDPLLKTADDFFPSQDSTESETIE